MFSNYFYHATFKNAIKIFGKLFSNIHIKKGEELILVPISYSAKDKLIQKYNQFLAQDERDELTITIPRIGFLMGDPQIDKTKQLNRLHKLSPIKTKNKQFSSYNSIPYIVPFYLSILTKNSDEMFQIVEQIIPFFSPELSLTINDIPSLELETDYVYKLDAIAQESNTFDGTFDDRRLIVWTISFSCELNIYHPVIEPKLIKKIIIEGFQDDELTNDIFNFSTEVIPQTAQADEYHILKDIWQDEQEPPSIQFLSESYEVFITNFKNVIQSDYEDEENMLIVWNMIKEFLGIIDESKQLSALVATRKNQEFYNEIKTTTTSELTACFSLKDENSITIKFNCPT